tara:strand:+ start:95 stop:334 length:240 start_codon:yes stop_codon:yes gene_type:complete
MGNFSLMFKIKPKMPMTIFTHLNKKNKKQIIDLLDQEIKIVESAISAQTCQDLNERLLNYSQSLYIIDDKGENDTVILN